MSPRDIDTPETVWLDPRVAARLPDSQGAAREQHVGPDVEPVGYMREDIVTKRILEAGNQGAEIIMSIQTVGAVLSGLSTFGRLFAHGVPLEGNEPAVWHLITESELAP